MKKVLVMMAALAAFAAVPAVASAQDTVSSGNTQTGAIGQDANAGNGVRDGVNDHVGDGVRDHVGSGGNAGNQACLIQQNAGRDANAACNQSQNFSTGGAVARHGVVGFNRGATGVSGVGGVQGVTLARTGFDARVLALIGGVAVAGGLGLLAAGRRGRLTA